MMKPAELNHAEENAAAWYDNIADMMKRRAEAREVDVDDIDREIDQSPLSVEVRSPWYQPGSDPREHTPCEFCILLSTGGPALRIVGDLDDNGEPTTAQLQWQDWGTPWTEFWPAHSDDARVTLLLFASRFCFG